MYEPARVIDGAPMARDDDASRYLTLTQSRASGEWGQFGRSGHAQLN